MTPTVIQRLREALGNERTKCIGMQPYEFYQEAQGRTYDALAAVEQELAAKDAEIAELRKDKERLDWIIATDDAHWVTWEDGCTEISLTESEDCFSGASFREAIDKARAEAPK